MGLLQPRHSRQTGCPVPIEREINCTETVRNVGIQCRITGFNFFCAQRGVGGTLIGAFVIGVLSDGLVLLGVSEFWQIEIKGIVIILAVVVDQLQQRLQR